MKKVEESSKRLNKFLSNFLIDQKVAGNSPRTIQLYSQNVSRFIEWLEKEHGGADLSMIELRNIKLYTLHLKESMKFDANRKQETDCSL
jgi:site-specific recombinase XerD